MKKLMRFAAILLSSVLILLAILLPLACRWALSTWSNLTMDEILYHLTAQLGGVDKNILRSFALTALLPAVIGALLLLLLLRRPGRILCAGCAALILSLAVSLAWFDQQLHVLSWIRAQRTDSTFIADHYADPAAVQMTFPQKKRNLVYIYLESMETTYADVASGGGKTSNLIPQLTRIAQENEDFSGNSTLLGGGNVAGASTWTMAAMFAQTAGLPLKISIEGNAMEQQPTFFPGITSLGDILNAQGYEQVLLVGSNATFGGRRLYFSTHGDYAMRDLVHARTNGWVPPGYGVFWGFEDEKLFDFARNEFTRLSAQDAPFNLTLLTVDTHFEDGYLCRLCGSDYGSDQYANVIACSDCQVASFLAWLQQQPCYEDTAVVIAGDHLTMDINFCNDVDSAYDRRVYTAFINAAGTPADPALRRAYTTYDLFPTTLAAMGVKIDGNRLGLGTNLFSVHPTLLETYGQSALEEALAHSSRFMEEKAQLFKAAFTGYDPAKNTLRLHVEGLQQFDDRAITVEWSSPDESRTLYSLGTQGKKSLDAAFSLPLFSGNEQTFTAYWVDQHGNHSILCQHTGHPLSSTTDAVAYLQALARLQNCSILMAVKDEASDSITPEIVSAMRALGLTCNLTGQFRTSYYAAITPAGIAEEMGYQQLEKSGELPDGHTYQLLSAGYDAGNHASVLIDDNEYALNERGLNIVVYSHACDAVIDTLCIDLYEDCVLLR